MIIAGHTQSLLHISKNFESFKDAAPLQYFDLLFNYWQKHNFAFETANGNDYHLTTANIFSILFSLINIDYEERGPKNCMRWKGLRVAVNERPLIQ